MSGPMGGGGHDITEYLLALAIALGVAATLLAVAAIAVAAIAGLAQLERFR